MTRRLIYTKKAQKDGVGTVGAVAVETARFSFAYLELHGYAVDPRATNPGAAPVTASGTVSTAADTIASDKAVAASYAGGVATGAMASPAKVASGPAAAETNPSTKKSEVVDSHGKKTP